MSRARARRSGTICDRSMRTSLASASCNAASAACTLPAIASCWPASNSTCSISFSASSSREGASSRYSPSSAACCDCDSARRASSNVSLASASRNALASSVSFAWLRAIAASAAVIRRATSVRSDCWAMRPSNHAAATASSSSTAITTNTRRETPLTGGGTLAGGGALAGGTALAGGGAWAGALAGTPGDWEGSSIGLCGSLCEGRF